MNAKISEKFKVDAECLPLTSAAGNTSQPYDLANHGRAMITVSVLGTYSTVREGTWRIAVTALDAEGNESASADVSRFFDLSAPAAPTGLRVS